MKEIWTYKNIRFVFVVFSLSLLSACYSLPDFLSSKDEGNGKRGDKIKRQKNFETSLTRISSSETNINEFMKDWETLRPAVMRVVALEQDMQFLLQSMSDVNSIGPIFSADDNGIDEFHEAQEVANFTNSQDVQEQTDLKFKQPLLSSVKNDSETVSLKSAPPINERLTAVDGSDFRMQSNQEDKFFNAASEAVNPGFSNIENATIVDNKFQNVALPIEQLSNIGNKEQDCSFASTRDIGKGQAVHLVSYKSKKLLSNGVKTLSAKFDSVLCGKIPLVKEVEVKGNTFYSMRFGPFMDKNAALEACSSIKAQGQYCGVTVFDGQEIL